MDLARRAAEDFAPDANDAYCPRCGATVHASAVTAKGCPHCVNTPIPWQRLTRLAGYHAPVDTWLRDFKYHRAWTWSQYFGPALAERVPEPMNDRPPVVVPVPMHWTRRCWRGYDQADLLARALAEHKRWPYAHLLKRSRRTAPQTMINQAHRRQNVRDAFACAPVDLTGREVVLVDDVKTSGETLRQCTKLLQQHHAQAVRVAVVAVADPKGQRFETV